MSRMLLSFLTAAVAGLSGFAASRRIRTVTGPRPHRDLARPSPFRGLGGAVAILDIDDLASVNRTAGFDTGDRLLERIGDTLLRALPPGQGLERLGNGRFALWMPGLDLDHAVASAERLRGLAGLSFVDATEGVLSRSLSVGVTEVDGNAGRDRVLLQADAALRRAKSLGGARVERSRAPAAPRLSTREEVSAAIAAGQLHYRTQPIVRLSDGRAAGAEALLRWTRPDGATMGPDAFVDQIDRIPAIGADLLGTMAAATVAPLLARDDMFVSFNVTGALLDGSGIEADAWLDALLDALPAHRVVLELVESATIVCSETALRRLAELRMRGVRVALDDFGTGLSTLQRLVDFPVDLLKIDRAFVQAMDTGGRAESVIRGLCTIATDLGIETVAEGIETEAQRDAMRGLGVTYGQGWLHGRPMPAADLTAEAVT